MKTNRFGDAAIEYLKENDLIIVERGDLNGMHVIFNRAVEMGAKGRGNNVPMLYDHKRVLNALERDDRFDKHFISYAGIINRPTRCFELKGGDGNE